MMSIVQSSQRVKEEMAKKLPGYTESMDVVDVANLYDKHFGTKKHPEKGEWFLLFYTQQ